LETRLERTTIATSENQNGHHWREILVYWHIPRLLKSNPALSKEVVITNCMSRLVEMGLMLVDVDRNSRNMDLIVAVSTSPLMECSDVDLSIYRILRHCQWDDDRRLGCTVATPVRVLVVYVQVCSLVCFSLRVFLPGYPPDSIFHR
jgi:hypothetical protein